MKSRLLELLVCPACGSELVCEDWKRSGAEIEEGLLRCSCGQAYPIIGAVPRMLLARLREQIWHAYPDYLARHRARLPHCLSPGPDPHHNADADTLRTQQSFGFEWTRFSAMRPEWERNYWAYLAPKSAEFLHGKVVLDAGCGMGRHLHITASHAAAAVGVDFSNCVDVAYRNTSTDPRAHVVQADLNALPFRAKTFDFIYSLGVLHHLAEADQTFRRLLHHLKPGGDVRVYLYRDMRTAAWWKRVLLACASGMRRFTTRMPHQALLWVCYPISAGLWITFVGPYALLRRIPPLRNWADRFPLKPYADYPFGVLLNDTFDRLSVPIENRYSEIAVRGWLEQEGLEDGIILPYAGWLGHGRKPSIPTSSSAPLSTLMHHEIPQ